MGSACSTRAIDPIDRYTRSSTSSSLSFAHIKRGDADEVLEKAPIGYYLFSQDAAGEQFLSVSVGKYVCHHPIFKQGVLLIIGGECFVNVSQVLEFYRMNPLGAVKLTREFVDSVTPTKKLSTSSAPEQISAKKLSTGIMTTNSKKNEKKKNQQKKKNRRVSFKVMDDDNKSENEAIILINSNTIIIEERSSDLQTIEEKQKKKEIFLEVSSADEKEHVLGDEPIPVLPAPTGIRPPPLFQSFSMLADDEEFLSDPFNINSIALNATQLLFQLCKGNPVINYTRKVNTLKLIVTGQADTYNERCYFADHFVDQLQEWSHSKDFYLEYIDMMLDHEEADFSQHGTVIHQQLWQQITDEIKHCNEENIPYLLLVYSGHEYGKLRIPHLFRDHHFEVLKNILPTKDSGIVKACYEMDENSVPPSYVLTDAFKRDDSQQQQMLVDVFKRFILSDQFPVELCSYFLPGRDTHTEQALESTNSNVLFVERLFYDYDNNNLHYNEISTNKDELQNLWTRSKCFYEQFLLNNNLEEDEQILVFETTWYDSSDQWQQEQSCKYLSSMVFQRIKSCLESIQLALDSSTAMKDVDYDEVLYHNLATKSTMNSSIVNEYALTAVKDYIKGKGGSAAPSSTLLVHGESSCGKSALLSRVPSHAFEFFNGLCCIVCRFIGHTPDSSSLSLLLRSVCLQLSYAYSTDPNAVPNDTEQLVDHFHMLLELATDSLPLVVVLDSIDLLQVTTNEKQLLLTAFFDKLPSYVKMIVSINSHSLKTFESECILKFAHPNFTQDSAYELLDHVLVHKDRTLNSAQKELVTSAISTNHEPVFVRMLMKEIEEWKSSTSVDWIPFDCITTGLSHLLKPSLEDGITDDVITLFIGAVTLDRMGIPQITLLALMTCVLENRLARNMNLLFRKVLLKLSSICECKFVSGLEFVRIKDSSIFDILQSQSFGHSEKLSSYLRFLHNIFVHRFDRTLIHQDTTFSEEKLTMQITELSFFYRILLKYSSIENIKSYFTLNFNYLESKLTRFSFMHTNCEVEQAREKYPTDYEIGVISELFDLSKEALHQDPSQLPLQIICRLKGLEHETTAEDTHLLKSILEYSYNKCSVLKPSIRCLVPPASLPERNKKHHSTWNEKDLKLLFVNKTDDIDFMGWSCDKASVCLYNEKCETVKQFSFPNLNRVLSACGETLVIETNLGRNVLFNINKQQCLCSFHNEYRILAGNEVNNVVVLLKATMQQMKLFDTRSLQVVWQYDSHTTFNNVCLSENGSILLCFTDVNSMTESQKDNSRLEEREQIDVLHLINHQKISVLLLPKEASFSKTYSLSKDGQYFVHMTSPDMNLLVWEIYTGKLLHSIEMNCCRVVKLDISSETNIIVTVSTDASIRVFSLHTGCLIHTLTESIKSIRMDDQHCLSISADGRIAIYYVKSNFYPSFIAVWDIRNGIRLASLTSDFYGLNYQISPDSNYILSNSPSGIVKFQLRK